MVLNTLIKLCVTEPDFLGNYFCRKNWGNGPKVGFLNLKKNSVINFYWISSIIFVIYYVDVQILYLRKILFLRYMLSCFFISNTRLKLAKNKLKAKQQLILFENYSISSSMLSSKTNIRYSKKRIKNKGACFNEIT